MLPHYKIRTAELSVKTDEPFVINPKPSTSFRPITLLQSGWALQSDKYAAVAPIQLHAVTCADEYIDKFEDILRQHKDIFLVYAIRRIKNGAMLGAITFPCPLPKGFIPRLFHPISKT